MVVNDNKIISDKVDVSLFMCSSNPSPRYVLLIPDFATGGRGVKAY